MGALYKALKYYTRQVVQGHEAARDALMEKWMKRYVVWSAVQSSTVEHSMLSSSLPYTHDSLSIPLYIVYASCDTHTPTPSQQPRVC